MRDIQFRYTVKRPNGHTFGRNFFLTEIEDGKAIRWLEVNQVHVAYTPDGDALSRSQYVTTYGGIKIWEGDKVRNYGTR